MFRQISEPQSFYNADHLGVEEKDYYKARFADIISEFADNEDNIKAKDVYNALVESIKEELDWHVASSRRLRGLLDLISK